ncbi:MAG: ABC transporter substrate-binding protein [Bacteroidetes bacterium]|nr:ABC transporter substrate-binding protein [Bacteroidota bacterium]
MDIALWNLPYSAILSRSLATTFGRSAQTREVAPEQTLPLLLSGAVDIALLPTVAALRHGDDLDVFPGLAVSSWSYPFAKIELPGGLGAIGSRLELPEAASQEAFVASLVLQEHYNIRIGAVPSPAGGPPGSQRLVVGLNALGSDGLDLGQEWYELANYPMVWGVLAMRKGEARPSTIQAVVDAAAVAERLRQEEAPGLPEEIVDFFQRDLRFRFDDLATASITELTQYLFFYLGNDEIDELPLVHLPENDDPDDVQPLV